MAKKKSKSKPAGKKPKKPDGKRRPRLVIDHGEAEQSGGDSQLFAWREPRKRSICRPSSAYRFLADLNGKDHPNLAPDERYLYLGPIPNRPGRCTAIEISTGRVIVDNHPEDFEEVPREEL